VAPESSFCHCSRSIAGRIARERGKSNAVKLTVVGVCAPPPGTRRSAKFSCRVEEGRPEARKKKGGVYFFFFFLSALACCLKEEKT